MNLNVNRYKDIINFIEFHEKELNEIKFRFLIINYLNQRFRY